jgi:transcriptional regulator with XRE-family HTH domain
MLVRTKIKQIREQKNLSIKELSKQTGISVRTIYNYENTECSPLFIHMHKLANYLDTDIQGLIKDYRH